MYLSMCHTYVWKSTCFNDRKRRKKTWGKYTVLLYAHVISAFRCVPVEFEDKNDNLSGTNHKIFSLVFGGKHQKQRGHDIDIYEVYHET